MSGLKNYFFGGLVSSILFGCSQQPPCLAIVGLSLEEEDLSDKENYTVIYRQDISTGRRVKESFLNPDLDKKVEVYVKVFLDRPRQPEIFISNVQARELCKSNNCSPDRLGFEYTPKGCEKPLVIKPAVMTPEKEYDLNRTFCAIHNLPYN